MSPVGGGGGEEDLWHVRSGGRSVTRVPSGRWGEEDLCHVCSGGHSVTHVPSRGWGRRGGSLPCRQWWPLRYVSSSGRWGKESRISAMYTMGDTDTCP